jgi:hypothetical protein
LNPGALAPAAHPRCARTVALRGLRPACWTPSASGREAGGVPRGARGGQPYAWCGPASWFVPVRTERRWRRGESNPGPQGFQLTFVHVRSRITQATGFVNSVTT